MSPWNRPIQHRGLCLTALVLTPLAAAPTALAAAPPSWATPTTTMVSGESLVPIGSVAKGVWAVERDATAMGSASLALYQNATVMLKTTKSISRVSIAVKGSACAKTGEDGNAPGGALGLPRFLVQVRSGDGSITTTQTSTAASATNWETYSWRLGNNALRAVDPAASPNVVRIWFDNNYTDAKAGCSRNLKIDQVGLDSLLVID